MSGESLGVGEVGLTARLAADGDFAALVGYDDANQVRLYHGYPTELLNRDNPPDSEFPRVTYFRATSLKAAKGSGDLRIQVDIWVVYGAKATLEEIDSRMLFLLDEERWLHDGVWLSGLAVGGESDAPAVRGRPLGRRREYWIGVN